MTVTPRPARANRIALGPGRYADTYELPSRLEGDAILRERFIEVSQDRYPYSLVFRFESRTREGQMSVYSLEAYLLDEKKGKIDVKSRIGNTTRVLRLENETIKIYNDFIGTRTFKRTARGLLARF